MILLPASSAPATSSQNQTRMFLLLECSGCQVAKDPHKFSTGQWTRGFQQNKSALCRRCEDKAIQKRKGRESSSSCETVPKTVASSSSISRLASSSSASLAPPVLPCSCSKVPKRRDRFSTKQWERGQRNDDIMNPPKHKRTMVLCRRCEEKHQMRKELGPGSEQNCIQISSAKRYGGPPKELSSIVPWSFQTKTIDRERSPDLPRRLTLDGYTREAWGLAGDETGAWETALFWIETYDWIGA